MKLNFKFVSFFFVFHIEFYLELFFLQDSMNILHFALSRIMKLYIYIKYTNTEISSIN